MSRSDERSDVCYLGAVELHEHYRTKALSPVEVTKAVLDRILVLNPRFNAFCLVDREAAMAAAAASEARWAHSTPLGRLDGIPATVKDLWMCKGWPTRRGSLTSNPARSPEDAPAVARLREQGAVIVGKTTTSEFGWKGVADSAIHGISRNPWDLTKTSGGSSGGAAIAAACGMGALHLGSDGAGSIRIPAAFCGVFGFKPTWGRVAAYPFGTLPMLSHSGPIVRTVSDARLMLTAIAKPDGRDWLSLPSDPHYLGDASSGIRGLRIAYSPTLGYVSNVDPEIIRLVEAAVAILQALGAEVELVDPGFEDPRCPFELTFSTGFAAAIDGMDPATRDLVDPGLIALAEAGRSSKGTDVMAAWERRDRLGRHMNAFHERFDLLVTPQLPIVAFEAGFDVPPGSGMRSWLDWSPFGYPFNFTGQPAASVPCGLTMGGMPVSFQMVGPRYGDGRVMQACAAFEAMKPFVLPQIQTLTDSAAV